MFIINEFPLKSVSFFEDDGQEELSFHTVPITWDISLLYIIDYIIDLPREIYFVFDVCKCSLTFPSM